MRCFLILVGLLACSSAQTFPGLTKLLDNFFEDRSVCYSYCITNNLETLTKSTQSCTRQLQPYFGQLGQINSVETFYDVMVRRTNTDDSRLCGFYKALEEGCIKGIYSDIDCPYNFDEATTRYSRIVKPYICEKNPDILSCILHPSHITATDGFVTCLVPLQTRIGSYFNSTNSAPGNPQDMVFAQFDRFYKDFVTKNNGDDFFGELETFATCLADKVKSNAQSLPCEGVEPVVRQELMNLISYFDFRNGGRDLISCGLNTDLWRKAALCVNKLQPLFAGTTTTTTPAPGSIPFPDLKEYRENYVEFRECFLEATDDVCGKGWTYKQSKRFLDDAESLFSGECSAAGIPRVMSTMTIALLMSAALMAVRFLVG